MRAREETTKVPEHNQWGTVLDKIKVLIDAIVDGTFKESRKKQHRLISKEIKRIAKEPIYADSYTLQIHSMQIMHDALMGQYDDESKLQFLRNFISPFLKNNPRLLGCVANTDIKNGHYDIPFGVTSIGKDAFWSCTNLTRVTIPKGVTSIGNYAFWSCTELTSVTIPKGMMSIGCGAFKSCTGLTAVTIPQGVISIGDSAFLGCTGLTAITIPQGVISIGDFAFSGCAGLTAVTIPQGVTSIGNYAFGYCTNLTAVINTSSNQEEYQCILRILPAKLREIAIVTEKWREKTTLIIGVVKSGQGFFANMPSELTGTIIAKLAQLHGQPQVDEPCATRLTKS